ncbi:hypothetical protein [Nocardiopsis algeriensis]|uniref:Cytoskeletal protein RodZ n=1 Tax=Nocardiopsis algeriensis TaxID=1478215 RepID=A0A841IKK8_9ACTN|nr:hypothetical protein [Nocardiopsis algeriensis]MBB6118514.1 cytoskeletal protein RodZ [Nocardiopsis algeriensis]
MRPKTFLIAAGCAVFALFAAAPATAEEAAPTPAAEATQDAPAPPEAEPTEAPTEDAPAPPEAEPTEAPTEDAPAPPEAAPAPPVEQEPVYTG